MRFEASRFIGAKLREIKTGVGDKGALVATSGGVESMVCALLAHKALGSKAVVIFIDDGLMRISDEKRIKTELKPFGVSVEVINAKNDFQGS